MFKLLIFIALTLPFFAFAQAPIPRTTLDETGGVDETYEEYEPVTRQGLLAKIKNEERRLESDALFQENKKELAVLTILLNHARSDNTQTKIDDLEKQIAEFKVVHLLQTMPLENIRYALARLDDKQFFKSKNIPSLLKENNRLSISLDNVIKSLQYRLEFFPFDESAEREEQKKSIREIDKIRVYIAQLEEWKNSIDTQRVHLLSDRNRYRHALEIAVIKKTIQTTSASLKFLNTILWSRRNTLFAELQNALNTLHINTENEGFDIIGTAQKALKNPLHDIKKKYAIRNLLAQEEQLRNSPIHLLFWEANKKISQLYRKLLEVEPDSAFDIRLHILKTLYIPPSVVLPTTEPGI